VRLCGSIRSFVLHVVLCGEACRHVDMPDDDQLMIETCWSDFKCFNV
jgi:hypothetical protein